jgi:hypothetical protein
MEAYSMTLSDIEMIHESATMLESLYLMYTEIPEQDQDISDVLESDIVPATSVTSLTLDIQNAVSPDDVANFLIYVSRKYPNLQNFEISDTYLGLYDDFIEHIYTNGFLPLISKLRPTLQNITTCLLPTGLASDLFKAFDESQCRIQQLTLKAEPYTWDFHSFQSIEQLKYIQVLKLERFSCTHFQWLGDFNVLKQLSLNFSQDAGLLKSVQLNEIVHFCQNTVEIILLQQVLLTCKDSKDIQLPSLKKLELFNVELDEDTDIFISKSLPNLRYLTLLYYGTTGMYFYFPNLDLYCLDIRNTETEEAEILKVDVGGEHRFYAKSKFNRHEAPPHGHVFKYDERMFPPNELWNDVASNDEPITTVVCASIRNVVY